jgi:hypothetical protein
MEVRNSSEYVMGTAMADYILAFGVFARTLPAKGEYASLHRVNVGLELCDSLTLDGHKLLNVVSPTSCASSRDVSKLTNEPAALRQRHLFYSEIVNIN